MLSFLSSMSISPSMIIAFAVLGVMIIVMIIMSVMRSKNKSSGSKSSGGKNGKSPDQQTTELETFSLIDEAMTPDEKKAYDYFHNDDDSGKKGCLHKSGGDTISDAEYDRLVMDKLNEYGSKTKALAKIGLDIDEVKEIEPIRLFGFEKRKNRFDNYFSSKIGDDGRWRSTVCSVTWLFFSNGQICIYSGKFDMLTSQKLELTDEYFYKDITNFTSITETDQTVVLDAHQKGCLKKSTEVDANKKLTDYDTFSLTVPGDTFTCTMSGVPNAVNVIEGVKQKLREKKVF